MPTFRGAGMDAIEAKCAVHVPDLRGWKGAIATRDFALADFTRAPKHSLVRQSVQTLRSTTVTSRAYHRLHEVELPEWADVLQKKQRREQAVDSEARTK